MAALLSRAAYASSRIRGPGGDALLSPPWPPPGLGVALGQNARAVVSLRAGPRAGGRTVSPILGRAEADAGVPRLSLACKIPLILPLARGGREVPSCLRSCSGRCRAALVGDGPAPGPSFAPRSPIRREAEGREPARRSTKPSARTPFHAHSRSHPPGEFPLLRQAVDAEGRSPVLPDSYPPASSQEDALIREARVEGAGCRIRIPTAAGAGLGRGKRASWVRAEGPSLG